ncbi:DUF881 domain-containing protein [Effusibacillus pohliae]|uniref:DUF881 domain-containing protein n=1 Tax=Effusibacillus pohliae TaxID=232270 RepID=UPI00038270E0|nr:DUF881 domain-containing protein [Effusibacillus pohliae]
MASAKNRLIVSLTVISVTLGFMMAVQYKSTQKINEQVGWGSSNKEVLQAKEKLAAVQKENKDLENHLNELNKQLVALEQEAARHDTSDIQKQLAEVRILAGTSPVKGPGIVLTIDDSKKEKSPNPITHDTDVMRIVNELFLTGAEAVSINGERVASASGILCVGPTVRVNDRLLTPPYKIEAIGDPATLIKGLTLRGGIMDVLQLKERGLQVQGPKEVAMIQMKGYSGDQTKLSSNQDKR